MGAAPSDDAEASRTAASGSVSGEGRALPDLTGRTIVERFRIDAPIADGGMSRVFAAHQLGLDRRVAVKLLKQPNDATDGASWLERFRREAAVLASLSHANLIVVHEFGEFEGLAYLVMEYAEGATLSSVVREGGPFTPQRLVRVALQIADGLDEAHAKGVVHRDLKPSNVMLLARDRVKVIDFGIAKTADSETETTRDDVRVGSPRYMSPEQVQNLAITPATDVYAIGCVMYLMATGVPPFTNEGAIAVMVAHVNDSAKPPRETRPECGISDALEAIIMRCLRKAPEERYASMRELMDALSKTPEMSAESTGSSPALAPPRTRSSGPMLGLAALVTALVAGGAWWAMRPPPPLVRAPALQPHAASPLVTPPVTAPPPPAAPERVIVVLDSVPSGARVERDGAFAGSTPLRVPVLRDEHVRLLVSHDEFQPETVDLTDVELAPVVRLVPVPHDAPHRATHAHPPTRSTTTDGPARRPQTDNLDPWAGNG